MSSIAADNSLYMQQLLEEIKELKQQQLEMTKNKNVGNNSDDLKQYLILYLDILMINFNNYLL